MKSFLGFTPTSTTQIADWHDVFEEYFNDAGQLTLVSKETFRSEQDEDIPEFEYKYVINCIDMYAYTSEEHKINITLYMIPLLKYASKETQDEMRKYDIDINNPYWDNLISYGYCVNFGQEYISYEPEETDEYYDFFYNILDSKDAVELFNVAATVLVVVNSMRGFNLDGFKNGLGTTGWDQVRDILLGENQIKTTINRYKEVM